MIERVLMVYQLEGTGKPNDVYRRVMYFFNEETLELITRVDPAGNDEKKNTKVIEKRS